MEFLKSFALWLLGKLKIIFIVTTPFVGLAAWFLTSLDTINAALEDLAGYIASLQSSAVTALPQIASVWEMARYFFPVDLALALAGILAIMTVLAAGVRILKSFVPTIS